MAYITQSSLSAALIAIGETAIAKEDDAALRDYYALGYVLHLPGVKKKKPASRLPNALLGLFISKIQTVTSNSPFPDSNNRSEEHTSELQSPC